MSDETPHDEEPQPPSTETTESVAAQGTGLKRIGHFHIKRVIATGGMGTVYEAVQDHPRRTVALKIMRRDVVSRTAQRRFEHESQLLARLRHPAVAQVYEAGIHHDVAGPVPYFAMEYVPNARSLTEYAQEKRLGVREKLQLFITVCEAVYHGHQKGIIHRDLKPSNVLVEADGQVKVIDFGVARATDSDMSITTQQTAVGELVGTLKYMSPEQCEADPHDIDTRSDVYALGVVLYELLSGRLPYDLDHTPVYDAPRVIREAPPRRIRDLDRRLSREVETILGKALEKGRDRRYRSALELADDIKRYLNNEPILAHPPSVLYRTRKSLARQKLPLSIAGLVFLLAVFAVSRELKANRESMRAAHAALAVARSAAGQTAEDTLDLGLTRAGKVISECTTAIKLDSELVTAYALRGKAYQRLKRYDEARADCEQALRLDPENSLALRTLGVIYLKRNEFAKALDAYDRGIGRLQDRNEAMAEDFHNRALLRRMAGDYELALADHDRALALYPEGPWLYGNRGLTRLFAGDQDGAIADFARYAEAPKTAFQANLWIWETRMLRGASGDEEAAAKALAEAARAAASAREDREFELAVLEAIDGKLSADNLLSKADSDKLRCCAYYYLGSMALVRHRERAAQDMFQRSFDTDAHWVPEHELARWHLGYVERR